VEGEEAFSLLDLLEFDFDLVAEVVIAVELASMPAVVDQNEENHHHSSSYWEYWVVNQAAVALGEVEICASKKNLILTVKLIIF
jgi:hypothetical protein